MDQTKDNQTTSETVTQEQIKEESLHDPKSINDFPDINDPNIPDYPLVKTQNFLKEGDLMHIRLTTRISAVRDFREKFKQIFKLLTVSDFECTLSDYKETKDDIMRNAIQQHLAKCFNQSMFLDLPGSTQQSAEEIEKDSNGRIMYWATVNKKDIQNIL